MVIKREHVIYHSIYVAFQPKCTTVQQFNSCAVHGPYSPTPEIDYCIDTVNENEVETDVENFTSQDNRPLILEPTSSTEKLARQRTRPRPPTPEQTSSSALCGTGKREWDVNVTKRKPPKDCHARAPDGFQYVEKEKPTRRERKKKKGHKSKNPQGWTRVHMKKPIDWSSDDDFVV